MTATIRQRASLWVLIIMLTPALCLAQSVTRIEVFSEGPLELPRLPYTDITHYDLTAPQQVKRQLPRLTATDEQTAAAQAKRWIHSPAGQAFSEQMRSAYDGHVKAMHYRLEKTPVIVFDEGEYIVYGSTNIRRALLLYRQQ
jgi:integrating conjugative element protein (TIGR03757 family)